MTRRALFFLNLVLCTMLQITPVSAEQKANSTDEYSIVAGVVEKYFEALKSSNSPALSRLTHDIWHHKSVSNGMMTIDKSQMPDCVKSPDCVSIYRGNYRLTTLQIFYDNFAIARLDDREAYSVTLLTLFKDDGVWRVANQLTLDGSYSIRSAHFAVSDQTDKVLQAMNDYYEAVEFGKAEPVQNLFHADWHMKNPDDGLIVAEGKAKFIKRIDNRPSKGYFDNRYTTDINFVFERLAMLRVDNPATQSSTIFTFIRVGDDWQMVDKAWSQPND